jgi:type IV pilus assembly protein PilX
MRNLQRGMVLIVSLVLLVALTLLGLTAMQNSSLEERMAGNARAENEAFQAAEAALRAGEAWLFGRVTEPATVTNPNPANNQVWPIDGPDPDPNNEFWWWQEQTAAWWLGGGGIPYTGPLLAGAGPGGTNPWSAPQPQYLIERVGYVGPLVQDKNMSGSLFFQVTARGEATGGRSEVLLRSTYKLPSF